MRQQLRELSCTETALISFLLSCVLPNTVRDFFFFFTTLFTGRTASVRLPSLSCSHLGTTSGLRVNGPYGGDICCAPQQGVYELCFVIRAEFLALTEISVYEMLRTWFELRRCSDSLRCRSDMAIDASISGVRAVSYETCCAHGGKFK